MTAKDQPKAKAKSFGENIESDLALEILRVVEIAAIASARTMGQGDRKMADQVATEAMRKTMDTMPMRGDDRDWRRRTRRSAHAVYRGEGGCRISGWYGSSRSRHRSRSTGRNESVRYRCAGLDHGARGFRKGRTAATRLTATWKRSWSGPSCKDAVYLDAPVSHNLKNIARRLDRDVEDLVVIVLDRPRHEKLIADIRAAGARIRLIGDGDLSAGIAAAVIGTGVHAVMGSGGAPEGVITAAAIRCLNGYMLGGWS